MERVCVCARNLFYQRTQPSSFNMQRTYAADTIAQTLLDPSVSRLATCKTESVVLCPDGCCCIAASRSADSRPKARAIRKPGNPASQADGGSTHALLRASHRDGAISDAKRALHLHFLHPQRPTLLQCETSLDTNMKLRDPRQMRPTLLRKLLSHTDTTTLHFTIRILMIHI